MALLTRLPPGGQEIACMFAYANLEEIKSFESRTSLITGYLVELLSMLLRPPTQPYMPDSDCHPGPSPSPVSLYRHKQYPASPVPPWQQPTTHAASYSRHFQ